MMDWIAFKRDVVQATGLDRDALHIYAGIAIHAGTALLARRKLGDWLPYLTVVVLALANEGADFSIDIWPEVGMQVGKAVHDVVNTLLVPTFLLILARWRPGLVARS